MDQDRDFVQDALDDMLEKSKQKIRALALHRFEYYFGNGTDPADFPMSWALAVVEATEDLKKSLDKPS